MQKRPLFASAGARSSQPAGDQLQVLLAMDRLGYDDARFHGAGHLTVGWTQALMERGIAVTAVILRDPGPLGQAVIRDGLPFVFLGRSLYDPRTYRDFLALMRNRAIDVAHLQGFGSSTFGRLAARRAGVPVLLHVHTDHRFEPKGYPLQVRIADRLLASATDRVIATSGTARTFAIKHQGLPPERVEVWPNPVDLEHFRPPREEERSQSRTALGLGEDAQVVVCVGRFDPVKGIDLLLKAWRRVSRDQPGAHLVLVGDGPLRADLEGRAAASARPGSVHFAGYRDDVREMLWSADLLVVPSRSEGSPLALIEGLAAGLPAVAFAVGGIPEVLHDGQNGLLVSPGDVSGLAAALVRALADGELRARLAASSRSSIEPLGMRAYAARLETCYRELAEARGRTAKDRRSRNATVSSL
jgi:glycosyltransferase involved in cell wall biosynthesis